MRAACAFVLSFLLLASASAQEWPARPVRFVVPAPPGTPPAIAEKLSAGIIDPLQLSDVRERLARHSAAPIGLAPAQMAKFLQEDAARWRQAMRAAGIKPGEL